jgi:hypothetical protein
MLLRGLSPDSVFVLSNHQKERVIDDPVEAERYVSSMFG